MNISKVAKRARVSAATVSRTINGSDKVSAKTKERVWRVIESTGYQPNLHARALVSGKSGILGLIIADLLNPFFPRIVHDFENIALKNGYEPMVANIGYDPARVAHSLKRMLERKVEGVVVFTTGVREQFWWDFAQKRIPVVIGDGSRIGQRISSVNVDYEKGIREAVEYIAELGHKRVAYVDGPVDHRSTATRREVFLKYLQKHGLTPHPDMLLMGNHRFDGGEAATKRLLELPSVKRPTTIFTSNDLTALGALRALYNAKVTIPEEISVVGLDDLECGEFTNPPLTTIRISRKDLAEKAFVLLQEMIQSPRGRRLYAESSLVVRGSTGPCLE